MKTTNLKISLENNIQLLSALHNSYKELKEYVQSQLPYTNINSINQIKLHKWIPILELYKNPDITRNYYSPKLINKNKIEFIIRIREKNDTRTINPLKVFKKEAEITAPYCYGTNKN